MVYSDTNALAQGLIARYSQQGSLGAKSIAEAKKKVRQWAQRVKSVLRKEMRLALYKPGAPKWYKRTGQIFNHIGISYSNGIAEASANVHYTDYPSYSFVSAKYDGGWDVMWLLDEGYSVQADVPWRDIPYCGQRPGGHLMEYVARILRAEAAAEGVTITLSNS